jgi:hypothetical protein
MKGSDFTPYPLTACAVRPTILLQTAVFAISSQPALVLLLPFAPGPCTDRVGCALISLPVFALVYVPPRLIAGTNYTLILSINSIEDTEFPRTTFYVSARSNGSNKWLFQSPTSQGSPPGSPAHFQSQTLNTCSPRPRPHGFRCREWFLQAKDDELLTIIPAGFLSPPPSSSYAWSITKFRKMSNPRRTPETFRSPCRWMKHRLSMNSAACQLEFWYKRG